MANMMEYECPCCGGVVAFDTASQKLKCPYCDTEFDVDAMETLNHETAAASEDSLIWDSPAGGQWEQGEQENLRVYVCQSCGGQIIADVTTGSTSCPYCNNNVIVEEQFSGDLRPDYIIPFKLDKGAAIERLKAHFKGKKLLPRTFQSESRLEEIKGIYVPFWIFDADAEGEIRYKGTKVSTWADDRYAYTRTSYFDIVRAGTMGFERIPVDGSSKIPDALMESIEPYDFSEAVPFKPAYMAGFLANRYDVTEADSEERANNRIRRSTLEMLERDILSSYTTKIPVGNYVNLSNGDAKYALYPVWLLNLRWKDQDYLFAMNGQTGKMVGDLPIDKGLAKRYRLKWTLIIGLCFFGIMMMIRVCLLI